MELPPEWVKKHSNYYLSIADVIRKERIRCYSRQIGGILVKDDKIISTGFNGPPRGLPACDQWDGNWREKTDIEGHDFLYPWRDPTDSNPEILVKKEDIIEKCPRRIINIPSGGGLEYCPAVHCERNLLLTCASLGISTQDSWMFLTCGHPCKDCIIEIIQAEVKGVICGDKAIYDNLSVLITKKLQYPVYYFNGELELI